MSRASRIPGAKRHTRRVVGLDVDQPQTCLVFRLGARHCRLPVALSAVPASNIEIYRNMADGSNISCIPLCAQPKLSRIHQAVLGTVGGGIVAWQLEVGRAFGEKNASWSAPSTATVVVSVSCFHYSYYLYLYTAPHAKTATKTPHGRVPGSINSENQACLGLVDIKANYPPGVQLSAGDC